MQLLGGKRRHRHGTLGRALRQVGKEQIGRTAGTQAASCRQYRINEKQPQRLVGFAGNEIIQVFPDRSDRLGQRYGYLCSELQTLLLERAEQCLEGFGDLRHPIQSDDGKRTIDLVDMGAAEPELCRVAVQFMLDERFHSTRKGQVDLTLDPGQRTQIEFGSRVHSLSRISLNRP